MRSGCWCLRALLNLRALLKDLPLSKTLINCQMMLGIDEIHPTGPKHFCYSTNNQHGATETYKQPPHPGIQHTITAAGRADGANQVYLFDWLLFLD